MENKTTAGQSEDPERGYRRIGDKRKIDFNINRQEAALLESWMESEGWANISGFIKSRLFGDTGREYDRLLAERGGAGARIALSGLVSDLALKVTAMQESYVSLIGSAMSDSERTDEQKGRRRTTLLKKWRDDVLLSNADVLRELRLVSRALDDRQDAPRRAVRQAPAADEGFTSSSEAEQERARRMYEEFTRKAENQ